MRNRRQIIYYDFAALAFIGHYLEGFVGNQARYDYQFQVSRRVPSVFRDLEIDTARRETLFHIGLFEARVDDEAFLFCIDMRDQSTTETPQGFHLPLLEKVRYYFKVNHNTSAIDTDPILHPYRDKILTIPPFIPVNVSTPWRFWPRPFPSREIGWTPQKARGRLKALWNLPRLDYYRSMRQVEQDLDVFFVTEFYTQDHHNTVARFRYELARELSARPDLNAVVGLVADRPLPSAYQDLQVARMPLNTYLHMTARAKVAVYVRGPHNCLSYKLGQLLAMGKPIVGQRLHRNQEFLYSLDYFDDQFAYESPQEFATQIAELVRQPDRLALLSRSNAAVFDTRLAPIPAVSGLLPRVLGEAKALDPVIAQPKGEIASC